MENKLKPNKRGKRKKAKHTLKNVFKNGLQSLKKIVKILHDNWIIPLYIEVLPFIVIYIIATLNGEYNVFKWDEIFCIVIIYSFLRKENR